MKEKFADPTFDLTFKMLFGNEKHKDILISLLNSLLGFEGDEEITEVEINSNEFPVSFVSSDKGESGISSSVDILCTNKGKQKIAVEMQRQKTKYFLAREKEYMSKLITNQVKEGEGQQYHEKVLETYIIIIGKSNIFTGNTALKDQKLFEIDVVPTIIQTQEVFPGNKMYWKFFELPKFMKSDNYKNIAADSPLKNQWLEFLEDCAKQYEEPERHEIIKKGYEIMEIAKWDGDTKVLYWKQKVNEQDLLETQEDAKKEAYEQGEKQGFDKGKMKGEIKGEISKIKMGIENELSEEKILKKLHHTKEKFPEIKQYFAENPSAVEEDDNESILIGELGIELEDVSDIA